MLSKLAPECDESAVALCTAARMLQRGLQAEIRNLCKPWGVQLTAKNDDGKYSKRSGDILKSELTSIFIEKAREHFRTKATQTQQPHDAATMHLETKAHASNNAAEHTETEFHIDEALVETLDSLQAIENREMILIRVIDHACFSEHSISNRLVDMLRLGDWEISTDLYNDQPLDACGYIAADAVSRLRDAALSESNSWHTIQLPDYAQLECISRGNKVLHKQDDQRILDTDEVNRLVRHYSHLDQRHQAAEEWWAGAVALDHFLAGLPNVVQEITTTGLHMQHQWRIWIVNTQTSRQLGSHWFTVVVGTQQRQSTAEYRTSASSARSSSTANELQQTSGKQPTTASCLQPLPATHYLNLFGSPDSALSDALLWARTNARQPQVASWLEACSQWDSAIAAGEHRYRKKRRKLCKNHNILCTHLNLSEG